MHYAAHALLNCVAWFSLLSYGNAAKAAAPSEVPSRLVGSGPVLANEANRSSHSAAASRRQVDTRQVSAQDAGTLPGNLPFPNQGVPYQFERAYQFRYPSFAQQQLPQNFFQGQGGVAFNNQQLPNGLPVDPRFFQGQLGLNPLRPVQPELPKNFIPNGNGNVNSNLKDNGNVNSIQNQIEGSSDSKSTAQNRPFISQDFGTIPIGPGQPGLGGIDPSNGNLRVDNRFSAIDYERIRQNYYSDPSANQQRNFFSSFNEIPFAGGSPFRSPLAERYNLDYSGGGSERTGAAQPNNVRTSNGAGGGGGVNGAAGPYFGGFLQSPYSGLGFNSQAGGGAATFPGGNPDSNFRSPFGGLQFPGAGFNGALFPGTGPTNLGDSPLRASSSKDSVSETGAPAASELEEATAEQESELESREAPKRRSASAKRNGDKTRSSQA